jgi:hypothetical protein
MHVNLDRFLRVSNRYSNNGTSVLVHVHAHAHAHTRTVVASSFQSTHLTTTTTTTTTTRAITTTAKQNQSVLAESMTQITALGLSRSFIMIDERRLILFCSLLSVRDGNSHRYCKGSK